MVLEEGLRAIEKCYYSYMDRLRRVQGLLRFGEDPSYSNSSINSEALQVTEIKYVEAAVSNIKSLCCRKGLFLNFKVSVTSTIGCNAWQKEGRL